MIYIAAPFFNEKQIKRVEKVEFLLECLHLDYFSPRKESNLLFEKDKSTKGLPTFELNIKKIKKATKVIVITNDKDTGTLFEAGFAFSLKKPIYYLYETTEKGNFNIMLAHSGIASTSIEDLEEALLWPYEAIQKKRMEDLDVF